jgi:peptidoglycan-N-acetylglucosamine deacetylase
MAAAASDDTARVWDACRRNGVGRTVLINAAPGSPEGIDRPDVGLEGPALSLTAPARAASAGPAEVFAATLAGAGLAVLLLAGIVPGSGTALTARLLATGASIAAAGAAWLQARRFALAVPTVIGAAGSLTAVWLLWQSTGGLSTIVSGVLLGLFVGVMYARLPPVPGPLPRRATMATGAILLTVGVVAYPALSWLAPTLAVAGPSAVLLGRPLPDWSSYRRAWWVTASSVVALSAVLASWVAANSAGANVANHGSRRSQEVAVTFDGTSDNATMQRLVGILDDNQAQATFFVPAPVMQAGPQVGTLVLDGNQLLANEAGPHDWGAWLDPGYRELTRDQRAFAQKVGVCPTFLEWPGGQPSPIMAAAVRRHGMTIVSPDVRANGRGDLAGLVRQVLSQARPGSIIALRLGAKGAGQTLATSTVVQAVAPILQGLQLRGLRPVALDQLLHVAPYTRRC